MMRIPPPVGLVLIVLTGAVTVAHGQQPRTSGPWHSYDTSNGQWQSYAGDVEGTKYSPLDQINAENFGDLEVAWEWTSVDRFVSRSTPEGGESIVRTAVDQGLAARTTAVAEIDSTQAARLRSLGY